MEQSPVNIFIQQLDEAFQSGNLLKITLSKPRQKSSELKNIIISPVKLKGGLFLQFVMRYNTRDITKNYGGSQALSFIQQAMQESFLQADMYLSQENVRLLFNKKNQSRLLKRKTAPSAPASLSHNRTKDRLVQPQQNLWLKELGITNSQGEVRHEMKDKFVQINRYVELLRPELEKLPAKPLLKAADMGSGKGYLTFALYDFLVNQAHVNLQLTGVEYRADLVEKCNQVATLAGFQNLSFVEGTIYHTPIQSPDILIALHACDTATDEAIFKGIRQNTTLIVCAPCCHKQIRTQLQPHQTVAPLLKHGILMERQAEIITDGLRALIMEAYGYTTRVFEFISSAHTAKNLMIVGRKTTQNPGHTQKTREKIEQIKQWYGISQHYLEYLLEKE